MNVVCLLGSPRPKSNSTLIAKRFADAAEKEGANVRTFTLNNLKYRGCQACMACKTRSETCVLKDDLADVLRAVQECDVLFLASPVYYGEVSSQLKAAIDRFYSFLGAAYRTDRKAVRLEPGKRFVFAVVQGNPDETLFADIFPRYDFFMKWYGFKESHLIRACGVFEPGAIEVRGDVLALAEEVARKVCAA